VEALLALDSAKARERFARIPPPQLPRLNCADFLLFDVGRFYDLLGRIASLNRESRPQFLRKYVAAVTSPVQVGPMARVLASADLADSDFQDLVAAFCAAIGKISDDDRSFTFSPVGSEFQALAEELKKRKLNPLPLIEAYRLYLVIGFSGARCADND